MGKGINVSGHTRRSPNDNIVIKPGKNIRYQNKFKIGYDTKKQEWLLNGENVRTLSGLSIKVGLTAETHDIGKELENAGYKFKVPFNIDNDINSGDKKSAEQATFVSCNQDLIESVITFMSEPEYWRDAIGNNPKYFIHYLDSGINKFGLSKFCAFKNISLEDYVIKYRSETNGNITQKHICKITGKKWVPIDKCDHNTVFAFKQWFEAIADNNLKTDNINIISLNSSTSKIVTKTKRHISPEELEKRLERQREIGAIGEEIAMKYELTRLTKLGTKDPTRCVQQVSLLNAAAGFDIRSISSHDNRYIEVKSTTVDDGKFFISQNEIDTLEKHGDNAYIYMVVIEDVNSKKGRVIQEIKNPIKIIKEAKLLKPIMYQASFPF